MSDLPAAASRAGGPASSAGRSFSEFRSGIDQRVLRVFHNKAIKRSLREQGKVNLELLWGRTVRALAEQEKRREEPVLEQADIHRAIVEGLPGEALYISCAIGFDSIRRHFHSSTSPPRRRD